ncbi:type I-C CRISPR-associated protein Cas5c [Hominenteromicrobium sp.]
MRWVIRRIYVLNPIEFTTIRRNEVKSKILGGTAMRIAQGKEDEPYLVTTKQIVQRASMVLTNVHYVIEAEFEMLPEKAAPGDNPGKFQDIVTRRMRKGQCFSTPYFGCREFPAHFKQWEGGPIPTIDETRDLGFMLYDFDYSDPQNITPLYFRAKMEHGVIQVAGCEVFR